MTNREAMEIVLALAKERQIIGIIQNQFCEEKQIEAFEQMEDYYNDVMED